MKWIITICAFLFLSACEKDTLKIQLLTAKINGDSISFIGNAQKYSDLKNGNLIGYNYHIFNLKSPNIYIEAYDSLLQLTEFDFQYLNAKYADIDSLGNSTSYDAVDGFLNITEVNDGVIYGNFKFTFINTLNNLDTLNVTDGYLEISLEYYNRAWNK